MSPTSTPTAPVARSDGGADPRIVERRRSVDMDRRRRRHRVLAVVLVAVSMVAGAWLLVHSPVLDVEAVDVQGTFFLDPGEVVTASGIAVGDAMLRLDTASAVDALQSNPWIDDASVYRSWFDGGVVIEIAERQPVAAVVTAGGDAFALVDVSGQVLAVAADPAGLPVVAGVVPGAPGERLDPADRGIIAVAGAIPSGLGSRVQSIIPGSNGRIELLLNDGAVVRFGGVDDVETKVRTVQTVLATVDMQCVVVIDVAVANTAVLTRGEPCA